MRTRNLGCLEVSSIGVGCMGMSHAAGKPMDEREAINVIREAVDMGYTLFDTAKNYGFKEDPSHNEKLIGKALEGLRDKVKISTKCGVDFDYETTDYYASKKLMPELVEIYIPAEQNILQVSSSLVKNSVKFGKELFDYVPQEILADFLEMAEEKKDV